MARRKVREYQVKKLLSHELKIPWQGILVTSMEELENAYGQPAFSWLREAKLTIKPDQLFGKRMQYGLVGLNLTYGQVREFLSAHAQKQVTINGIGDALSHFLIELYIEHTQELYLSLVSLREGIQITFSTVGGAGIEGRWESSNSITIPTLQELSKDDLLPLCKQVQSKYPAFHECVLQFILSTFYFFQRYHFAQLEFNPFTIVDGQIHILDAVAQVDDCAADFPIERLGGFPLAFGRQLYPEEKYIQELNQHSGASLKLTILNPQARIWNVLSGGGASIIVLDALVQQGLGPEIANYGEYSGNPSVEESYLYVRTILEAMTMQPHPQGKILCIAGAIANFTDIEQTFSGVARALLEYKEKLQQGNISIVVRRGGPHWQEGLDLLESIKPELNVEMHCFNPEQPLLCFVPTVVEKLSRQKIMSP